MFRLVTELPVHANLDHVSGAWAAQAFDAARGMFYRPLFAPDGYGGTRYAPLHIVLHAGLIKLGMGVAAAGQLVGVVSAAALTLGAYTLLRGFGVEPLLAGGAALAALGFGGLQSVITSVRGDLLAAALNMWALACCVRTGGRPPRLAVAGTLFALTLLTKQTSLHGLAAVCVAWLARGEWRAVRRLLMIATAVALTAAALIYLASNGRAAQLVDSCTAGAWGGLIGGVRMLLQSCDWPGLALVVLAIATALPLAPRERTDVPFLLLAFTLAGTWLLFTLRGIFRNHVIDAELIAIVFLIVRAQVEPRTGEIIVAAIGVLASISVASFWLDGSGPSRTDALAELGRSSGPLARGPLLSENPWVPLLAAERPFLLDAFCFRTAAGDVPEMASDLQRRIEAKAFRAVVLNSADVENTASPWGGRWYGDLHFYRGFPRALRGNYELRYVNDAGAVFLPRASPAPAAGK